MKIKLLVAGWMLVSVFATAQDDKNLVKNPGFETTTGKLKKGKQISLAKDWVSPTGLGADLYSTTLKEGEAAAPLNPKGKEQPMDGNNYAGVVMFSYQDKEPRTYIRTELLGPLKAGMEYCVRFNVSLSDNSKYAVNNISAIVSKKDYTTEEKKSILEEEGQIHHSKNKVFNATYGWETVCGVYKAKGGEKYLLIGNFSPTKDTKNEKMLKPKGSNAAQLPIAYYYVDEVAVFALDSIEECMCEEKRGDEVEVVYNESYASNKEFTLEEKVEHEHVYFDHLSAKVSEDGLKAINTLVTLLNENPSLVIEAHAHSEKSEVKAAEKDELQKDLAKRRSDAVKDLFTKAGISAGRIQFIIEDDKKPIGEGDTDVDKAKNRCIDFKVRK
ncbi:MAG: OmpA family protein [Bacteroidota bacterium]